MIDAEFAREITQPLTGDSNDYDPLLQLIGDAICSPGRRDEMRRLSHCNARTRAHSRSLREPEGVSMNLARSAFWSATRLRIAFIAHLKRVRQA
jgi:hypothetical protein